MSNRRQLRRPTALEVDRDRRFAEMQSALWAKYLELVSQRGDQ